MNKVDYIDSCFSPVPLRRDGGFTQYVSCNSCESCRQRNADKWSKRLEDDMLCGKYYYRFVTLTYNNFNLPKVHYSDDFEDFKLSFTVFDKKLNCNRRVYRNLDSVDLRSFLGINLPDNDGNFVVVDDKLIPHYVASASNGRVEFDTSNSFGVVFKEDVQKFIKRLRQNLYNKFKGSAHDYRLRFYVVSEYGPKTFRPHYHILFSFNDPVCCEYVDSTRILDIWGKQDIPDDPSRLSEVCKPIQNIRSSARYISGYLVKCVNLPRILQYKDFRTFSSSSTSVPFGSQAVDLSDYCASLRKGNSMRDLSFYDETQSCFVAIKRSFNVSFTSRYFPKFVGHRFISPEVLHNLFRIICKYFKQGRALPDLRYAYSRLFPSVLGVNSRFTLYHTKHVYDYSSNPFSRDEFLTILRDVKTFKTTLPLTVSSVFTPAQAASYLLSGSYRVGTPEFDICFYLFFFGIPRNYTICRRIYQNFVEHSFLSDTTSTYFNIYNLYYTVNFSNNYSRLVDFINNRLISTFSTSITPDLFYFVYSGDVPRVTNISHMTQYDYDLFDKKLNSFGLSVEDFFDSSGEILRFSMKDYLKDYFYSRIYKYKNYKTLRYTSKYYHV